MSISEYIEYLATQTVILHGNSEISTIAWHELRVEYEKEKKTKWMENYDLNLNLDISEELFRKPLNDVQKYLRKEHYRACTTTRYCWENFKSSQPLTQKQLAKCVPGSNEVWALRIVSIEDDPVYLASTNRFSVTGDGWHRVRDERIAIGGVSDNAAHKIYSKNCRNTNSRTELDVCRQINQMQHLLNKIRKERRKAS